MGILLTKVHPPYNDFLDCEKFECEFGEFRCTDPIYCVPIKHLCDGINHCNGGEDENFCGISIILIIKILLIFSFRKSL